jgi:hypothetical protein
MKANERLYLTAEGLAEILKAEWKKQAIVIDDCLRDLEDYEYGEGWSELSPMYESLQCVKDDLKKAREKYDSAARRYYKIKGEYPDGIPF